MNKKYRIEECLTTDGSIIFRPQYFGLGLFERKWKYFRYANIWQDPGIHIPPVLEFDTKLEAEAFFVKIIEADRINSLPKHKRYKYHEIGV